jgi:hypothetical protein
VLLEINRHPVRSIDEYRALTADGDAGDILTLYVYNPKCRRARCTPSRSTEPGSHPR